MAESNGPSPIVEIKDVVKRFPVGDSEITILKGISFEVKTGEVVSIVGRDHCDRETRAQDERRSAGRLAR